MGNPIRGLVYKHPPQPGESYLLCRLMAAFVAHHQGYSLTLLPCPVSGATLVVSLAETRVFRLQDLWRDAAEFCSLATPQAAAGQAHHQGGA